MGEQMHNSDVLGSILVDRQEGKDVPRKIFKLFYDEKGVGPSDKESFEAAFFRITGYRWSEVATSDKNMNCRILFENVDPETSVYFLSNGLVATRGPECDIIGVPMTFDHYAYFASMTARTPDCKWGGNCLFNDNPEGAEKALTYLGLGVAGEGGEYGGKVKKWIRGDEAHQGSKGKLARAGELGGVLWYAVLSAVVNGFFPGALAEANLRTLEDRQKRGVLKGDGDDR